MKKLALILALPALLAGCVTTEVGHDFDMACVHNFQKGVTTKDDAVRCLGEPTQIQQSSLNNGRERFVWFYSGMFNAQGVTKRVSLIFNEDGTLRLIEDRQATGLNQ